MRDGNGRWVQGSSGNPQGRPRRGQSLAELIRVTGDVVEANGTSRRAAMCAKLWELAVGGNLTAMRLILEYVEGRPLERAAEPPEGMPPFTADEMAEAERRLLAFRQRLAERAAGETRKEA